MGISTTLSSAMGKSVKLESLCLGSYKVQLFLLWIALSGHWENS